MRWLRRIAAAVRALLTAERKIARWCRVQHGQEPHIPDREDVE